MKGLAVLMLAILTASLFFPWVTIESKHIVVSGFFAEGTSFGKPGAFHVLLCCAYFIFLLIPKVWSVRAAFFISAINVAWAVRNYVAISSCYAGICPEKKPALYVLLFSSLLMAVFTLLVKVKDGTEKNKPS
jgi:hypothetical protein